MEREREVREREEKRENGNRRWKEKKIGKSRRKRERERDEVGRVAITHTLTHYHLCRRFSWGREAGVQTESSTFRVPSLMMDHAVGVADILRVPEA